jgi:hypothetical protein
VTISAGARAALGRPRSSPGWGRLTWVTWRQHRATLLGLGLFLAVVAAVTYLTGIEPQGLSASFQDRCLRGSTWIPQCGSLFSQLRGADYGPLLVPLAVGMFLGAPLLAQEYATGTARFAWTQSTGRGRQLASKLTVLGLGVLAAGGLLGWLGQWSMTPPFATQSELFNPWRFQAFNATPQALAGATLLGLAAGVLAGAATRRVIPAMAATAVMVIGLFTLNYTTLHPWLLSLGTRTARDLPAGVHPAGPVAPDGVISLHQVPQGQFGPRGSWLDQGWYTGPGGHRITGAGVHQLMTLSQRQLTERHLSFWVRYQPARRHGLLLFTQAGAEVLLALLLGALAVWLVRRRRA